MTDKYQLTLQDQGCGSSELRGVPVYSRHSLGHLGRDGQAEFTSVVGKHLRSARVTCLGVQFVLPGQVSGTCYLFDMNNPACD